MVGFAEISATATVFLKGPPTITSARRQYGTTGMNTRIECTAFSVPKVNSVLNVVHKFYVELQTILSVIGIWIFFMHNYLLRLSTLHRSLFIHFIIIIGIVDFDRSLQARHVSWTFMGREINANNNPDYSIIEELLPEGIKSILIIRESQTKHFGSYNCTVVNEHGNDIMEIELLRQGM